MDIVIGWLYFARKMDLISEGQREHCDRKNS